jgi:ribonuclease P protein component
VTITFSVLNSPTFSLALHVELSWVSPLIGPEISVAASLEVCRRLTNARNNRFPRSHRLTRGTQLSLVLREGKRIRTEHLDLRIVASLLHHPRVGFIVPKHGRSIVERNQLKRRLREIVRQNILQRIPSVDMIVRARPEAYSAPFASLERELLSSGVKIERLFKAE